MNDKIYIHEFIHITRQNRARYMHHMTANWSPLAQEERHQLCYGVWGVVGSTGPWPQTVNIWEEDGFAGLAKSFGTEFGTDSLQDPALAKWWAAAAELRSGGFDRILIPHPETATIEELTGAGVRAEVFAHELITLPARSARTFLHQAVVAADKVQAGIGWRLVGAWRTAMHHDDEVILLWAIPSWEAWAAAEEDLARGADVLPPADSSGILARNRILLANAPLSPFRTGRQPSREDRTDWTD